jgi:hypothetical protein
MKRGNIITVSAGKNKVIKSVENNMFFPLNLNDEKAKAANVPVTNLPIVVKTATIIEFNNILPRGISFNASL